MNSHSKQRHVTLPYPNSSPGTGPDLDLIGGSPALNFVNTLRADAGTPLETLHSDRDVRAWMKKMGFDEALPGMPLPAGALLHAAKTLRGLAKSALEQKKAGKRISLTALNDYLSQSVSCLRLYSSKDSIELRREYRAESAEQFLAPVAESVAELLAASDFSLIRQCEGSGCVLWFSDRPNGRSRRFCTEETCGTRTRVAAHRARHAKLKSETGADTPH